MKLISVMASLRSLTYETVRWEPRPAQPASAGQALGTYHPAVPAAITDLTLDLPPAVLAEAEGPA